MIEAGRIRGDLPGCITKPVTACGAALITTEISTAFADIPGTEGTVCPDIFAGAAIALSAGQARRFAEANTVGFSPTGGNCFNKSRNKQGGYQVSIYQTAEIRRECLMKYEAGQVFHAQDIGEANALASQLRSEGFCSNLRRDEDGGYYVRICDCFTPTCKDANGYFIEDDALERRIEYEQSAAGIGGHFFMTDSERGDSENCLQFAKGTWDGKKFWGDDKLYITPELFLYTNLERAVRSFIPDFDVYGFDYSLSTDQWKELKTSAHLHGGYLAQAMEELDKWAGENPTITIICI